MQPTLGPQQVFRSQAGQYSPQPPQTPQHPEHVAILVAHGMGQQVPYETIEDVAYAVALGASNAGAVCNEPVMRYVRLSTSDDAAAPELMRAEFTITDTQNVTREVHIYEAYWAPLTAGKVTAADVISFLFNAGWNGISNTEAGTFKRWMFGAEQRFKLKRLALTLAFLGVVALLAALLLVNAVVVAAAASRAIGAAKSFPAGLLLVGLTWDLLLIDAAGLLIAVGILIGLLRSAALHFVAWFFVTAGAAAILYAATLTALRLMSWIHPEFLTPEAGWEKFVDTFPFLVLLLWTLEFLLARWVRLLLIEYVGDVAAYIAAHTVSKFWELRQQIWQTVMQVASAVYRARTANDDAFLYEKIIVAGHSLGSVIGYDVLNGLLLDQGFNGAPLRAAERTRMFLTFGSPLDKTAFIFRTQKDMNSAVREVAAAAVQPMIANYHHRPHEWVNLWSRSDIISGHLDYYDPPNRNNARNPAAVAPAALHPKAVQNVVDPAAHTPLAAHVEYWRGAMFASQLYRGITS